jgi:hypothetical protein
LRNEHRGLKIAIFNQTFSLNQSLKIGLADLLCLTYPRGLPTKFFTNRRVTDQSSLV